MNVKTIPIKLKCSDEQHLALKTLLEDKRDCFNYLSEQIFNSNGHKGKLNKFIVQSKYYYELKEKFPQLLTQVVIKVIQEVIATYNSIRSNKHKITEAPKQLGCCLQLDKRLYSRLTQESIDLPTQKNNKRIKCDFVLYERAEQFLKNNTPHDPKLYLKDNELFLAIPFDVPTPIVANDEETVLGIDSGIRCVATCSDGRVFQCKDFKETKRRLKFLRRKLQEKNTKSSRKHLKKIRRKIHNYSKNYIHNLSNEILRTDKNNIVVEDLKKIKEKTKCYKNTNKKNTRHNRAFGDIPIAMLFDYLTYKASILGKRVVKVSPEYTSIKDCRGKTVGVRQGRRYYCVDGIQFDADVNASVNIANKYLGKSEHPISYPSRITYMGRLLSTNQSSFVDLNSEKDLNSEHGQAAMSLA